MSEPHLYTSKYLFNRIKKVISELVVNYPIKTVIDIPAGAGALTRYLCEDLKLNTQASDYDVSKWQYPQIPIKQADLSQKIPFESNQFDLVICMEGIKHTMNAANCVQECARIAKPNGFVIITLPNDLGLQTRLRYLFDGFVDIDWKHPMDKNSEDAKNYVYPGCQLSLPFLYYQLELSNLKYINSYACHYRGWSLLLYILLFPLIFFYTAKACRWKHPLLKIMLSPVWQTGKRNIIVAQKFQR